jgi:ActR/RegA family two-component response regulator
LAVLLVTGAPSPAIAARAAELGMTKMLEKPSAEPDIMAFIDGLGG